MVSNTVIIFVLSTDFRRVFMCFFFIVLLVITVLGIGTRERLVELLFE